MGIILVTVLCLVYFSFMQYLYCWDKIEAQERKERYDSMMKRYK